MSETPFIGEIVMVGFDRVPLGWLACDGSLHSISEYETLFYLLGTTYGGNGETTFAVPDLRGRAPVHSGQGGGLSLYRLGDRFGVESVTLTPDQMPVHSHVAPATSSVATSTSPVGAVPAVLTHDAGYAATGSPVEMSPAAVTAAGGSQPHENRSPVLAVRFIIAAFGIFPSQA